MGKTHLATALGHIAVRRRHSVLMARAGKLFTRLKAARLDNSAGAEMRRLAHVQLLILDDFALQPLDTTETTGFYELIVERHRKTATVLTSNRDPSELLAMMAGPLLAQSSTGSSPPPTNSSSKAIPTDTAKNPATTRKPAPTPACQI